MGGFLLLLALLLPAQRPAPKARAPKPKPAAAKAADPDRWPLASLHVTGNKILPSEAILRATGLAIGQPVNRVILEAAAARLTDTGAFETLSFRYDPAGASLAVTFQVQEVVDLYPVAFERLDVANADLHRHLREQVPLYGPTIPATGPMRDRIAAALEARLKFKISGRLWPGPDAALRMTFRPAAAPPSIVFVAFEGAKALRDVDLQGAFYQSAVGVPYLEPRVRELLEANIRPMFEEKGRLRVVFGAFRVEESQQPAGVRVTVPVEEGEPFKFAGVRITGHYQLPEKDIARLARLEEGALANFGLVRTAVADIERLYRRNGFLRVKITVDRAIDDDAHTVALTFRIAEGDQYRLRTLIIKGLDINAEAAVRRRWAIAPGQPFDDSYPDIFLLRIREEAMFEGLAKTTTRTNLDDPALVADVELVFHAEPPQPRRRPSP